jgi:plasmid stability protein
MVVNVTLSVDEEVLRRSRLRALEQGTSVNAVVREFLEAYAGVRSERLAAVERLLELSEMAAGVRGGEKWTRDQLHERSRDESHE